MSPTITFGPSASETVANELGLEVDDEGYLINTETEEREIPSDSDEPMTLEEFGGAAAGSRIFLENDFNSVSAYFENHK